MVLEKPCPHCGKPVLHYRNPVPTVDIVIVDPDRGIVLIERANPPYGWALPGGFVDYGETLESAAVREAYEETGLTVTLNCLLGVYSDPERDPRQHTLSVVYVAHAPQGVSPQAGDDAAKAQFFHWDELPSVMAFDHAQILEDYKFRHCEVVPGI